MMEYTNDFAKQIAGLCDSPFEPVAFYHPDGDCIEFIARPDSFYAERVDELVTVYYSETTNEIIGALIKGIKRITTACPGLQVFIKSGPVRLSFLIAARAVSLNSPTKIICKTYQKLCDIAAESKAETDLCGAAA